MCPAYVGGQVIKLMLVRSEKECYGPSPVVELVYISHVSCHGVSQVNTDKPISTPWRLRYLKISWVTVNNILGKSCGNSISLPILIQRSHSGANCKRDDLFCRIWALVGCSGQKTLLLFTWLAHPNLCALTT